MALKWKRTGAYTLEIEGWIIANVSRETRRFMYSRITVAGLEIMKLQRKHNKLRESARGQSCVMCSKNDGTIVLAHRNLPGDFGMGMKGFDWHSAYLCASDHAYGDGEGRKDYQFWELACYRTMKRFIEQGLVKVG